jgi:hypothetical protein
MNDVSSGFATAFCKANLIVKWLYRLSYFNVHLFARLPLLHEATAGIFASIGESSNNFCNP